MGCVCRGALQSLCGPCWQSFGRSICSAGPNPGFPTRLSSIAQEESPVLVFGGPAMTENPRRVGPEVGLDPIEEEPDD
jgi:hypothetical protein